MGKATSVGTVQTHKLHPNMEYLSRPCEQLRHSKLWRLVVRLGIYANMTFRLENLRMNSGGSWAQWTQWGQRALAIAAFGLGFASGAVAQEAEGQEVDRDLFVPLHVVELFTSQGCPNCPSADVLLTNLAQLPQVLALSIHVDYWDYQGWRDPYGSAENTQRQMNYKEQLALRYAFTPQFILNGRLAMETGSLNNVEMALQMFAQDRVDEPQEVVISLSEDEESFEATASEAVELATAVWVFFDYQHQVTPNNGRNNGKQLQNTHNVTRWAAADTPQAGASVTYQWPDTDDYGRALLISDPESGEILAAVVRINHD